MSWLRNVMGLAGLAALTASAGCGTSSPMTTAPSTTTYTETFTGSLGQGGEDFGPADSPHHFTVHQAGPIDGTLTDIQPLSTITLGLEFGIWDSTAATCTPQLSSPAAKLNLTLGASVNTPGELCVGVYDVGNISTDTITYTVKINHT